MFPLTTARHGAACIYCSFRAQQSLRQSHRLGQHLHAEATPSRSHGARKPSPTRTGKGNQRSGFGQNAKNLRGERVIRPSNDYRSKSETEIKTRLVRDPHQPTSLKWTKIETFEETLDRRTNALKPLLKETPLLEKLNAEIKHPEEKLSGEGKDFNSIWARFCHSLGIRPDDDKSALSSSTLGKGVSDARRGLRDAFLARGEKGLDNRLRYEFYAFITNTRFTASDVRNQKALADLRYPSEWFPATRTMHRKIHLHVGPTNSGKTYHALQRLEQAESGVYAGPLRLLAHEVYTRMNAKGKPCALITGEERRAAVDGEESTFKLSACTVEMVPLNKQVDVAVIDEIQMIGNTERGWAWTQALLGVKAKEVHLCGEERTVPLLKQICASLGEEMIIHRYERLSPLEMSRESLDGELSKLRKGDCVVCFSVIAIHSLRRQIERLTGKKVATVYGSLPPETRAQQARLFNDPDNDYDYLVASDAVGMGLNLAIKRIIFETSSKNDGYKHRPLGVADIKQIAGRAGRYRTAAQATQQLDQNSSKQNVPTNTSRSDNSPVSVNAPPAKKENTGYVTTLRKFDFPVVSAAMNGEPEPIRTAGLFPPGPILERFSTYFPPGTPFAYILTRLHELSQMHTRFHLCGLKDQVYLADLIEPIEGLTVADRNMICSVPASASDHELWKDLMPAFARCIAEQAGGNIVDMNEMPLEVLDNKVSPSREYLRSLEQLHKGVVCYLWLSYRFAGVFRQRLLANHVRSLVEEKIEKVLASFSFSEATYQRFAQRREQRVMEDMKAAVAAEMSTEQEAGVEDRNDEGVAQENREEGEATGRDSVLREQTSLTAGGDRFAGEEDLDLDGDMMLGNEDGGPRNIDPERRRAEPSTGSEGVDEVNPSTQAEDQGGNSKAGHNQLGGVPPKHLSHLETNVTELERNVESRP